MHIPDGFLDAKTAITTAIASTGDLGYAVKEIRKKLGDKHIPLLGVTAAVILDNGKIVADGLFFDILSKFELLEKHRLGLPPGFSIKKLKEDKKKLL